MIETFNSRITKGIINETIKFKLVDGVRVYQVIPPAPDEEVVGFTNFSAFLAERTITEEARSG